MKFITGMKLNNSFQFAFCRLKMVENSFNTTYKNYNSMDEN